MNTTTKITLRLGLLLSLAASMFWLSQYQPKRMTTPLPANTVEEFMIGVHAKRFTPEGELSQQLTLQKWFHYLGEPISHLSTPELTTYKPDHTKWTLQAQLGEAHQTSVSGPLHKIVLHNDVMMKHYAKTNTCDWELNTTQLVLHPQTEVAKTQEQVSLKGPNVDIVSQGLIAKLKTGHVTFPKQVQSHYVVANND